MAWPESRPLADGSRAWYAVWREPGTGRRRSERLKATTREAARKEAEGFGGEPRAASAGGGKRVLTAFLRSLKAERRSEGTIRHYREHLGQMVVALGSSVRRWNRPLFEAYIADHPEWAPRTVRAVATASKRMIGWAQDSGLDVPDFVGRYKPPRGASRESVPLSVPELRGVLEHSREDPILDIPVRLATLAGFSLGDIYSLKRAEVDLEGGWIARRRSKTGAKIRVPIAKELRSAFDRSPTLGPLACPNLPKSKSWITKLLQRVYVKAGVKAPPDGGYNAWHRARHSYGTLLAVAGVDVATVGRLLAHRHGSTTPLIYIHSDDERVKAAADAVARALGSA